MKENSVPLTVKIMRQLGHYLIWILKVFKFIALHYYISNHIRDNDYIRELGNQIFPRHNSAVSGLRLWNVQPSSFKSIILRGVTQSWVARDIKLSRTDSSGWMNWSSTSQEEALCWVNFFQQTRNFTLKACNIIHFKLYLATQDPFFGIYSLVL